MLFLDEHAIHQAQPHNAGEGQIERATECTTDPLYVDFQPCVNRIMGW
jgi:hypothetical protein